jgi:hypothetical protein
MKREEPNVPPGAITIVRKEKKQAGYGAGLGRISLPKKFPSICMTETKNMFQYEKAAENLVRN